ncbi:MAG: hypothetical protein NTX88_00445 [Candidatus Atribacteria bacterium]|nr:hypothetical protein [Candidatus Atribacteria bacterium]
MVFGRNIVCNTYKNRKNNIGKEKYQGGIPSLDDGSFNSGFALVGTLIAGVCLALFLLVAHQGLTMMRTIQNKSALQRRAAVEVINAIESMKISKKFYDFNGVIIQKDDLKICYEVSKFAPKVCQIRVIAKDVGQREIVSFETLAEE